LLNKLNSANNKTKNVNNNTNSSKTDSSKESTETKTNTNVVTDKKTNDATNKALKNLLNKLDNNNKTNNTSKTDSTSKTDKNTDINEIVKNLNIDNYETLNGKVDKNKQQSSNCWLLSAINTLIDDGEGALNDIVHISNSGEITVTFKTSNILFYDEKGEAKTINISSTPIVINPSELNKSTYNGYTLSLGDQEVRAIEIAYYKLVQKYNLAENQTNAAGLQLLYGDKIDTYITSAGLYASGETELAFLYQYLYPTIEDLDLSKYNKKNITAGIAANTNSGVTCNDSEYEAYLSFKKDILIESGKYSESEVEKAYNTCLKRQNYGTYNTGMYTVDVPTKSGGTVTLYDSHAYTVTGISNGYVTLINPHDNSKSFEISELYFKMIFNQISIVK
ncbi:hypothetical protein IJS77_02895, partial [bacterium]|nr:hypothetical protein [bacterium]